MPGRLYSRFQNGWGGGKDFQQSRMGGAGCPTCTSAFRRWRKEMGSGGGGGADVHPWPPPCKLPSRGLIPCIICVYYFNLYATQRQSTIEHGSKRANKKRKQHFWESLSKKMYLKQAPETHNCPVPSGRESCKAGSATHSKHLSLSFFAS